MKKLFPKVMHALHSLKNQNANSKMETTKEKNLIHSLVHNTSGVKGCVGVSGWGLGQMTSESIIHTHLHKPNNMLVST